MYTFFLLLISFRFTLSSASAPPWRNNFLTSTGPQEYVEITRPLPSDYIVPSCTLPFTSFVFGNTIGLPPTYAPYSPPFNCTWSRAALHLSATSNGTQKNRIAAVWIDGVEILRTSTPEPASGAQFWNVHKDITKYSSLLRRPNSTLAVMLPNAVNDVFNGVYKLNLTFLYYEIENNASAIELSLPSIPKTHRSTLQTIEDASSSSNYSLTSYDTAADLIIPISQIGDKGNRFRIEKESDVKHRGVRIPLNTYRAMIELYISFHGEDEFWYSNPPNAYLESNNLTTSRGNGAYREVFVMVDDVVVGSVIPFPVIFAGGINPLYWIPVVGIGAFDMPSYEIELTPFLGMILDGKEHIFGLGVNDSLSYWLVDANLHLWLDGNVTEVMAGNTTYSVTNVKIKRKTKFKKLDGKFKIKVNSKREVSAWVNSSFGNLTTVVSEKLKFKNKIKLKNNGTSKSVNHNVNVRTSVTVETSTGGVISQMSVKRKYPLEIETYNEAGSGEDYAKISKLENTMKEERSNGSFTTSLVNSQTSNGTMIVQQRVVVSGAANTIQNYAISDESGCYTREVSASGGRINNSTISLVCGSI